MSYLQFGLSKYLLVVVVVCLLILFFASLQTHDIEIPFRSSFALECCPFCVPGCVRSHLDTPGGTQM